MALFIFTKSILNNEPIKVFNRGEMVRDFTYIDDIVESLRRILNKPATPDLQFNKKYPNPSTSWAPYKVFNIGNSTPTPLIDYINAIEHELGLNAKKLLLPMQKGDVQATESDSTELEAWINFKPNTSIRTGVKNFVEWYKNFYGY
jgi:UDP-glucuronate 4-epimerase